MDSPIHIYDAVIVGAGPAGSALARALALGGRQVLLLDRKIPGRPRVCGGFLGPEMQGLFSQLGLKEEDLPPSAWQLDSLAVSSPSGKIFCRGFGSKPAYAVDRSALDLWLCEKAQEAGVKTLFNSELTNHKQIKDNFELRIKRDSLNLRVLCRDLIWACGRRMHKAQNTQNYFACFAQFEGTVKDARQVALHFVPGAHIGINPTSSSSATLCLYTPQSYMLENTGDLDRMLQTFRSMNPALTQTLTGLVRRSAWQSCLAQADNQKIFFKNNTFYVGDSVAMFSPIIGGGIPVAINSSLVLAKAMLDHRKKSKVASVYRRKWLQQFWLRFQTARWLGQLEAHKPSMNKTFFALEKMPFLFRGLSSSVRPF